MKKIIFFLLLIVGFSNFNAQTSDNPEPERKNDIMIDPIVLIAAPAVNFSYERLLNKDAGLGINAVFGLGRDFENFSQFSPYYRMYFGKKYASGFFVEGFLPVTFTEDEVYHMAGNSGYYTSENSTTVGLGVAFGGKWVVKRNVVFEASGGIGRRFGNNDEISPVTGKGMLGIGYRF